jgi:sugar lactone lactonase YvrE
MHLKIYLSAVAAVLAATWFAFAAASAGAAPSAPQLLYGGLAAGSGSTIGPDHALYANDPVNGSIVRIDPSTGAASTYADCLPAQLGAVGVGGGMDVAFIGGTAYALVSVVNDPFFGPDFSDYSGGPPDGIYRIDGPHSCSVVADIGAWSIAHPPSGFDFFLVTGVQYAMQPWRGGFLVTDGHHNRVLRVGLDGSISELKTFGDVVPTGLSAQGNTVYMAEAGPIVDGGPENGQIVAIDASTKAVTEVASYAPLLVDVERGRGHTLFGLAQGQHSNPNPGSPADPNTGELLRVDGQGGFSVVVTGLDRPTSLEIIGTTAYVVTLTGQILEIDNVAGPPYGPS